MLEGAAGVDVIANQIGMSGHSFGGWTTLKVLETDDRIRAALPPAPAGGHDTADPNNPLAQGLDFSWSREVPTLYLVGELDSILPLEGMQDLYERNPEPRRTVVLLNAIRWKPFALQNMTSGLLEGLGLRQPGIRHCLEYRQRLS